MFSSLFDESPSSLEYVINHVFFPVYHPKYSDDSQKNAYALISAVHAAARAFEEQIDHVHKSTSWLHITKMLEKLQLTIQPGESYQDHIISQFGEMRAGDILAYPYDHVTNLSGMPRTGDGVRVFPMPYDHVTTCGITFRRLANSTLCESFDTTEDRTQREKVVCSCPALAIEIPNPVFDDEVFRSRLTSFLCGTNEELFPDVLRGIGQPIEPKRITKHFGPTHIQDIRRRGSDSRQWSRSNLWFLIKVSIQSSLDRSPLGRSAYKSFILFFMYNLANASQAANDSLSSFLIHSMSAKILRRFRKLDSATSHQLLHDAVLHTCTSFAQTLDQRWQAIQTIECSPLLLDPSQLDLIKDIQSPSPQPYEYRSPIDHGCNPSHVPFLHPSRSRCTLDDFLSNPDNLLSGSGNLNHGDSHVVLYDFERAVAEDLDDWVARVTNVDNACECLEYCMYQYHSLALDTYHPEGATYDPDHHSIMLLTIIGLWAALDKLVIKEIPILANYSPEVPIDLLCRLLLHDAQSIHRLCHAYQYLFARHAQAHPEWSVLSNEFTETSFPCRYFDTCPSLQRLKASIEDTLPADSSYAKFVVFELQCPLFFDVWRSVTRWISPTRVGVKRDKEDTRVRDIPTLEPYSLVHRRCSLSLFTSTPSLLCWERMYYAYEGSFLVRFGHVYKLPNGPYAESKMQQYLDDVTHTSNEVLAAQLNCHSGLSSHEFITFAHLRSGGSLQWFNILQQLRSRTLDFHHQEVYLLLAQASAQVGPLDSAGGLLWHQELQDASFCHVLLDELECLFVDVGVGSLDGPAMAVISLLAGGLASKFSEDSEILKRTIKLIRNARWKTFGWVHELNYNAKKSPTNKNLNLLRDMAAVCRSTFEVGSVASNELFHSSTRDVEIFLSCTMLICTVVSSGVSTYSEVLLNRGRRLRLVLERSLRDAIQADPSDLCVDRAVQMVWPGYRPGPHRWKPLEPPNSRWLVCETVPTQDRHSQTMHVNLLDGSLLVGGKLTGNGLPSDVTRDSMYHELFGDCDLLVVASDLQGMDFVTMSVIHGHYVHFAVRKDNDTSGFAKPSTIIIRAEYIETSDVFELICRQQLGDDLPASLTENHVHWLNLSTSTIEIRPIEKPWGRSPDNWIVHQPFWSGQTLVTKGDEFLVDKHSPTWAMVSSCFRCLDDPENLIITVSPVDATHPPTLRLSATLPRYSLSFFINEVDNLESRDFKDMVYDEAQCIGTLFGLVNRLVLRPKSQLEVDLIPKLLLIPHSEYIEQRGHNIYIEFPSSGPVGYYTYQVDNELGCMKGIVGLESRLFLAHLHAFTSIGCRPDPLTGRTGVEEAISLIWLAGARQRLGPHGFWCSKSPSPQIRFAFAKIRILDRQANDEWELPSEDAVLQEAYLFPSEVSGSLQSWYQEKLSLSLDRLLLERSSPELRARDQLSRHNYYGWAERSLTTSPDIDPLRQLFSILRTNETSPPFHSQYISRLHSSAYHFQTLDVTCWNDNGKPQTELLRRHYAQCRTNYRESLDLVKMALGPKTQFEYILDQCGLWPRVTPFILLRCLASTSTIKLSRSWNQCLLSLALLALDLQRARRLLLLSLDNLEEELYKESENEGCDGWDAATNPDWLLIQLQGNFLIRRDQANVASEVMHPRSGKNTIMQVNMGEGKTSVIIPICAAALADGDQLVRVIVPKALIPQTVQLLTDRLCGLVDKPVYHLTFSREEMSSRSDHLYEDFSKVLNKVECLHKLVHKCRDECGIIVMQPEHILSLKLACVETQLLKDRTCTNTTPIVQDLRGFKHVLHVLTDWMSKSLTENTYVSAVIGEVKRWYRESEILVEECQTDERAQLMRSMHVKTLMDIQRFFEIHARDILDESDDVLRPQFQLIYAIGHQHPFEGSPDRWLVVQKVLGLLKQHAYLLSTPTSHILRCDHGSPGSFPHIHILQTEGGEQLISLIAQDVLDGRLPGLSFHSEPGLKGTIREFLLRKDIHPDTVKMAEKYAHQSINWGSLLLLRGLLAHNILLFTLTQRRWRVDYGLDQTLPPRTTLAIPYRAKDVPAETAEFGHPDITILLTCLSYYYEGLSENQLRISFELLLQQDDPSSEYLLWLEDYDIALVPNPLRKLSGVNIRSLEQWDKCLIPLFSRNKRVIDLYLSKVVFAKHAKEFPQRISGSNWDIAEQKNHLVTGFSGTNDGQYLLPTSIAQDDPSHLHQTGTNAKVLAYLLQPENSSYMVTTDEKGERWTTLELLSMVVAQKPKIRVLLDVGAQILDLSNFQLAKAWLECTPAAETAGAIYFCEHDELMVLARNGSTQPLSTSPLVQQLHRCVAYLDHAHTRGTDIRFPQGFRAAVTLGHKVTKDRLTQGCMRMRKLGNGHSIMFFAPHEVDQRIRSLVTKENHSIPVSTADILYWAILETWCDIQRLAPYWAQQGTGHESRYKAWSRFFHKKATSKELVDTWIQPELKSLVDMYMPCHSPNTTSTANLPREIRERCENLGVLSLRDARMDEEQEREVSREIERDREVKGPSRASPAAHFLHPDVIQFVRTGIVPPPSQSEAFCHVFATSVNDGFATSTSSGLHAWSPCILATADFCVATSNNAPVQERVIDYLRPVQWVLSGKMGGRDALVLLSPFEADQLIPEIRISNQVHLHLYVARTTKRMRPSDDLKLYSVPSVPPTWAPPWTLIDQLNVFAGQLYLRDHESYVRLCRFLGAHQNAGTVVVRNWFSNPGSTDTAMIKNRFEGTPLVPLIMQLLVMRRGMSFAETHMGRILDGWPLSAEDFDSPPNLVESLTNGCFGVEDSVAAEPISAHTSESEPTITLFHSRKRVESGSDPAGHQSKRNRPN